MAVTTPGYNFAAEMEANRQSAAQLQQQLSQQVQNPWMYNYGASSSSSSTSSGGAPTPAAAPARISYPSQELQYMKGEALNYPTYLRNLGEQMAQQAYQKQMSQGLRAGYAGQGYLAAQDALNRARLGYMGQAGQQAFDIAKAQEEAATKLYGLDIGQRGQDIGYQTEMARLAAMQNMQNSRGSSMTIGGGAGSGGGLSGGMTIGGGGAGRNMSGTYTGIGGDVWRGGKQLGYLSQGDADRAAWTNQNVYTGDAWDTYSGSQMSGLGAGGSYSSSIRY